MKHLRMVNVIFIAAATFIAAVILFLFVGIPSKTVNATYGVTFSRTYAKDDLGLDPTAVLTAALDDLKIRRFRLPAYWKFIEPTNGAWDFADIDADVKAISERKGTIVMVVGRKLPRWPECWQPDWVKTLSATGQQEATMTYIRTVMERYKSNPAIVAWQIENEPHFSYGDCLPTKLEDLTQEVKLARQIDPTRPVVTTDSGELSFWTTFGSLVDSLGVSTYRVVRNPILGTWRYWYLPPFFYERKATLLKPFGLHNLYVSEFQMEPWSNTSLPQTPIDDQLKTMDINQMHANFAYAERMQLSPVDFWGMEWWYWMKEKNNHPEFWESAKAFYANH